MLTLTGIQAGPPFISHIRNYARMSELQTISLVVNKNIEHKFVTGT
jgi:hypothetical protein